MIPANKVKTVYRAKDRELNDALATHARAINAILSGDTEWNLVGATGKPAFLNGWINYGGIYASLGYRKDAWGRVFIRGRITGGFVDTAVFTLPEGYRPSSTIIYTAIASESCNLKIDSDGTVTVVS